MQFVFGFLLFSVGLVRGQELRISQAMSAEEFRACGLHRLSEDELNQLDAWLNRFALAVINLSQSQGEASNPASVIETKIDGEFTGWEGETIFKLMDGQMWQQASYA